MNKAASSPTGKPAEQAPASYPVQLVPSPECARNPQTPPDYLRFLTQFPHLHADLALNPALPPDLEQWIKGHPDPRVQTNLRMRVQNPVAPAAANNSPLKSAGSSGTASEEQEDEDKFDATTFAGSVPPVTKSMPPEKETPPQTKAPFSPAAVPAAPGNPSPVPSTQVLPQPSAYPQKMPAAAYPPPASYPQSFPPASSLGYQPLPGQHPRPRRKRRWLIPVIAVIAVLAIIGGGIGAYFAFAGFKHVGYDSPEELADALKASLDESDLIGIAQMSAPSEDVIVEDALQLDEDLQKYISTTDPKSKEASGNLMDKVSDLTSVMQNLELDTSGLSSKVEKLSDDISRINYSGRIDVEIKDRDKLKASLDKLFFDNQSAPEKEKKLNQVISNFKKLENEGIDFKSRDSLGVMAVKEEGKWYYSVPMTIFDSDFYSPDNSSYENPHYDVNWVDPGETPSDSGQFAKELSGAITRVSNLDELTSEDCMRFLDMPERRIVMVYASPEAKGDMSPGMDLKISLSEDKKSSYGFAFDLDNLTIDVDDMGWEIVAGKGTYSYESGNQTSSFGDYIKNGKLQLVAKPTSQGLKLSFSGSSANLYSNLDYDMGYEYFQENKDKYDRDYEKSIEETPILKPYKKLILGYRGLSKKIDTEMDREEYDYD